MNQIFLDNKSVLMICYYYPPLETSGTQRSVGFVRELEKLSWNITVLTVDESKDLWVKSRGAGSEASKERVVRSFEWNLFGVVNFFHGVLSRALSVFKIDLKTNYFKEVFCFPDPQIAWFVVYTGLKLAKENDAVYVSCSPFSAAIKALIVAKIANKPLFVDFRDPWSLNPYHTFGSFKKKLVGLLEKLIVENSEKVILNSEGTKKLYLDKYPDFSNKFVTIENGYDRLNLVDKNSLVKNSLDSSGLSGSSFIILHVGSFYGSRKPDRLLEAIGDLGYQDIEFWQIGGSFDSYGHFKEKVKIKMIGRVSHNEALELMKKANLLYLKQGFEDGVKNYVSIAAKTYEYLATGLPILSDCPEGDNTEMVRSYAEKSFIVTDNSVSSLKNSIEMAYREVKEFRPKIKEEFKDRFSRSALAKKLSEVMSQGG